MVFVCKSVPYGAHFCWWSMANGLPVPVPALPGLRLVCRLPLAAAASKTASMRLAQCSTGLELSR